MSVMETQVTLTMQDQHQASVLQLLDSSRTSVGQAAQLLDCSERQVYRKLAAYRAIIWPKAYMDDQTQVSTLSDWLFVQYNPFQHACR